MESEHDHLVFSKFTKQVNKIIRLSDKISKLPQNPVQKKARDDLKKTKAELDKAMVEMAITLNDLKAMVIKKSLYQKVYEKGKALSNAVTKMFVHHCEFQAVVVALDQVNKFL